MIKARLFYNEIDEGVHLLLEGHAGGGPKGKDLVCAAVSALTYTLGEAVERMNQHGMLLCEPKVETAHGMAEIVAVPRKEFMQEVLLTYWVIEAGLHALGRNYPQSVRIEETIKVKGA